MKKIVSLLMVLILGFVLVACGGDDPLDPTGPVQTIQLSYADWGDPEFNQKMIDAFEVKYPNIKVTLRTDIEGSGEAFTGNLITAAQAGLLPDVFATDNVPTIINAGLTLDVAQYWDADVDTDSVYDNIALTGVYNGKRFAVPSFQFLKGIMINLDIFEEANLTTVDGKYRIDNDGYPVKDWTFEEFIEVAKAIKNFEINPADDTLVDPANTVVGLDTWYGSPDFQQVWPMMEDENVQYDTWDGTQFNYTSDDWVYAMEQKVEMHQLTNGTTTRFTTEVYDANTILQQYLIQFGVGAMDIEGSWQFWVLNEAKETSDINLGFWPYPSGDAGLFPPTILDYQAVSSQTDHPEEAYLLAKWMTFGEEGWEARLDLLEADFDEAEAAGITPMYLDRFPVANYPGVWDRVYDLVDGIEGIDYTFNRIEYAKPDLDKWLPGYKDFWAWVNDPENPYNWENLVQAGPQAVETYAVQWENKANEIVQGQLETLGSDTE
ncbi:ABC transporter substrate-binding protein [Mariniplasma anaerobium]|uniref:ABC transporter substrate-binding protein n=1 Tax=Mariniplasma anaerobium TaxID=2735436 RepID=A0A7U9TGM4_9MOLU|nr:ABC transporter substrate-binding protein [Mariniplasma anaerobium]BCR35790.1 ABC transporter substrate-binding protein [Mariniplasma anaerobium]